MSETQKENRQYWKIHLTAFLILGCLKCMTWLLAPWKLLHWRGKIGHLQLLINCRSFPRNFQVRQMYLDKQFVVNIQRVANSQVCFENILKLCCYFTLLYVPVEKQFIKKKILISFLASFTLVSVISNFLIKCTPKTSWKQSSFLASISKSQLCYGFKLYVVIGSDTGST